MASTYCTSRFFPLVATEPVPLNRSSAWRTVGGVVVGTMTVGATPGFPAGEGAGIEGKPATALSPAVEPAVVVVVATVVVVVGATVVVVVPAAVVVVVGDVVVVVVVAPAAAVVVVVVVLVDLLEKRYAPVKITTAATTMTSAARRKFLRRFASRCICSSFARRAAF